MRAEYIKRVNGLLGKYFEQMTGEREKTEVSYRTNAGLSDEDCFDKEKVKEKYFSLLMSSHDREIVLGATLYGVHKDDIDIKLNKKSARSFCSQGQQRSLALGLKLAEGEICKEEFGDYPVFLFDDVLSELDETRRDYMILQSSNKQVIITTCEEDFVKKMSAQKIITVKNGEYFEQSKEQ